MMDNMAMSSGQTDYSRTDVEDERWSVFIDALPVTVKDAELATRLVSNHYFIFIAEHHNVRYVTDHLKDLSGFIKTFSKVGDIRIDYCIRNDIDGDFTNSIVMDFIMETGVIKTKKLHNPSKQDYKVMGDSVLELFEELIFKFRQEIN